MYAYIYIAHNKNIVKTNYNWCVLQKLDIQSAIAIVKIIILSKVSCLSWDIRINSAFILTGSYLKLSL